MIRLVGLLLHSLPLILLGGCVASGPASPEGKALLVADYPIAMVDGNSVSSACEIELDPGEHSVTVIYLTYRWHYHCTFKWDVEADQRYEVVDSDNLYPLTLYRWVRVNSLWAARYNSVNPEVCEKKHPT